MSIPPPPAPQPAPALAPLLHFLPFPLFFCASGGAVGGTPKGEGETMVERGGFFPYPLKLSLTGLTVFFYNASFGFPINLLSYFQNERFLMKYFQWNEYYLRISNDSGRTVIWIRGLNIDFTSCAIVLLTWREQCGKSLPKSTSKYTQVNFFIQYFSVCFVFRRLPTFSRGYWSLD